MKPTLRQSQSEYDAIADAIGSTERGRRFLAEHVRRSRAVDTARLFEAVAGLERALAPAQGRARSGTASQDAAAALTVIARELGPAPDAPAGVLAELDGALAHVLAVAERLQDLAWSSRERGLDPALCDRLDVEATQLYAGCGRQETALHRLRELGAALDGIARALRPARV